MDTDLASALMADHGRADTPFGLYVLDAQDPAAALARTVEEGVFLETFGNTPEQLAAEYQPYDPACLFLCVLDHAEARPIGMMRLITASPAGFKTLDDLEPVWGISPTEAVRIVAEGPGADRAPLVAGHWTWDVATLAVEAGYRRGRIRGLVAGALYQGLSMLAPRSGVQWLTATLDLVVLDLIQRHCGRPFVTFAGAEPRPYLGSPASLPVYCDTVGFQQRLRLTRPDRYQMLFEGQGLEDYVSTPSWDERSVNIAG